MQQDRTSVVDRTALKLVPLATTAPSLATAPPAVAEDVLVKTLFVTVTLALPKTAPPATPLLVSVKRERSTFADRLADTAPPAPPAVARVMLESARTTCPAAIAPPALVAEVAVNELELSTVTDPGEKMLPPEAVAEEQDPKEEADTDTTVSAEATDATAPPSSLAVAPRMVQRVSATAGPAAAPARTAPPRPAEADTLAKAVSAMASEELVSTAPPPCAPEGHSMRVLVRNWRDDAGCCGGGSVAKLPARHVWWLGLAGHTPLLTCWRRS